MNSRLLILAGVVTLANAAKPVVVDDTAYLAFARHIAAAPADPYGFELFWYDAPEPAMDILCPPVLPYWLAAGVRVVGVEPVLLKLWLFPVAWLLAWALRDLLRRFAPGTEAAALPLIVLSPAVLPMVNLMLDVPAAALGLAALAVFARAADRGSWCLAVGAGLLAALAMQTKYTALVAPAVLGWYGLTHRRLALAVVAVAAAAGGFAAWEGLVQLKYGTSHFLHHAGQQAASEDGWLADKFDLVAPLAGHLGVLGVGFALYAQRSLGLPRGLIAGGAVLWLIGAALIAVTSGADAVLVGTREHPKLTLPTLVWRTTGAAVLLTALAAALRLLGRRDARDAGNWFVVGWVLLELGGYFGMTPFPAARRVIGVSLAVGVLAARVVSRTPARPPARWVVPFGVGAGVLLAALDGYDALPEKVLAERAAAVIPAGSRAWYVGHWGFQFYCERAGMTPAVVGASRLSEGDYLVLPRFPAEADFPRPFAGWLWFPPEPPAGAEVVAEFVWDDGLKAQTVPNLYGGTEPVVGRDHPRLRVAVYRLTRPWVAGEE
ncbi:glycosyltransferase family 39 protein [Urbifossiella limnaea]|uniref:Glycosyltransferase RgtA/B/C/D-like domain-containing protein n=1 Tax=Urbifossiella limnaea TaxID=2528023 RepID=A0A517XZE0_9BACT|nr:glycosyltransferase family 39 protein [Urbifossiella limnaea]QDU22882.1 hypothetical protein ETAA1_48710 [Urbifossiella limnaea]